SATPYPHGFKCFTCEKAADNYECNRWAPDVYCPRGNQLHASTSYLLKLEGFDNVLPKARLVGAETALSLWCFGAGARTLLLSFFQICTSCCEGSICNLPLPRNTTDAVFTTLSPL
ncbi:LYPD6 protein, partial [Ceuthmochares aereus]|nr:LYPD6 protein [Ceuthmochares aereus]